MILTNIYYSIAKIRTKRMFYCTEFVLFLLDSKSGWRSRRDWRKGDPRNSCRGEQIKTMSLDALLPKGMDIIKEPTELSIYQTEIFEVKIM